MSNVKVVTLHIIPVSSKRPLSFAERVMFATPKATDALWPVQAPEFGKDAAAKSRRTRNYFDALGAVDTLADRLASAIATGTKVHVNVYAGTVVTRTENTYSNVVNPQMLSDICKMADKVTVAAGAEDPRDYIGDDDAVTEEGADMF